MRAEAAEDLRRAREQALAYVAEGRSEADQLREGARRALERARAEAARLQEQRDVIAGELGQLSGVIEALSVPERDPADRPEPEAVPQPPVDADLPPTGASDPLPAPPDPSQENPDG